MPKELSHHRAPRFFFSTLFPLLLFIALMVFASHQSGASFGTNAGTDLSPLHVIEYFVLSTLIYRLLLRVDQENPVLVTILLVLLAGIADELSQMSVPGRTASVIDLLYDAAGASLILVYRRFPRLLF